MGLWEELPRDLIIAISQRLELYTDYVRTSAVCSSWYSAIPSRPTHLFKQIPWLMLPFDDETQRRRSFYSVLDDKVYHLELPETRGKCFRGSSHGWLVTLEMSPALYLLNPLTKLQVSLPPLDTFPDIKMYTNEEYTLVDYWNGRTQNWSQAHMQLVYIEKLVLSSPPHDNFLALAIYGEFRRLAFCSRGDKKWTPAETSDSGFKDVIFYEDKIYAVVVHGDLLVSDIPSFPRFTLTPVKRPATAGLAEHLYLVGSSKGLMMVERHYMLNDDELERPRPDMCSYKTDSFRIYLLESNKWSEITNLGDNLMFLRI